MTEEVLDTRIFYFFILANVAIQKSMISLFARMNFAQNNFSEYFLYALNISVLIVQFFLITTSASQTAIIALLFFYDSRGGLGFLRFFLQEVLFAQTAFLDLKAIFSVHMAIYLLYFMHSMTLYNVRYFRFIELYT